MSTWVYEYKKGQKLQLDAIYDIMGLGEHLWWAHEDDDHRTNDIVITRNVKFTITEE